MINNVHLNNEAKAWIKRTHGPDEVVKVVLDLQHDETITSYLLYTAFEENPDYLGRVLFDAEGYWIYDGELLSVNEQEQIAKFIMKWPKEVI
jgi:hypothetical protein